MTQPFLPNEADAFNANQAEPDSVDFEILLLGHQRTGVISGCAVTESSPAAQTVDVALGEVVETGEQISVSVQADVAVSAADGTNPRIDLISINSSGTVVVTAGTPAAQPVLPAVPATSIPLATLYVAKDDNTHADNQINDKRVFVADRHVFNVKDFGAVGDGTADDTAAIQAAIDAVIGAGTPASTTRKISHVVYLPPGTFKITAPLVAVSVQGLRIIGAGSEITFLKPVGTFDTVLDLDGVAYGRIGGFTITSGATHNIDSGIKLEWTTAASRSTTTIEFFDIFMRNLTVRAGFAIGVDDPNVQVSEITFYRCNVAGTWTVGESTDWQFGFELGNGVAGNTLNLNLIECHAVRWNRGVSWDSTNGTWFGGSIGNNGSDFYVAGAGSVISINQIRSEGSEKFLDGPGVQGSAGTLTISNVDFHCNALDSPYRFIEYGLSGKLTMTNVFTSNDVGKDVQLEIQNGKQLAVTIIGCGARTPVTSYIHDNGSGIYSAIFLGYSQSDGDSGSPLVTSFYQEGDAAAMDTGFFGATPVVQPDAVSAGKALENLGLLSSAAFEALEVSGATPLGREDRIINVDTSGGAVVITLPDVAALNGKPYLIRRDGANTVTIDRAGSDTFDDADIQKTLDSDSAAIGIFSIGDGEWKIVATEGTVGGS